MTHSEEMASRGQIVTDYAEAVKRLAALETEAEQICKKFRELSMILIHQPDRAIFAGQEVTGEYLNCPCFDISEAARIPALVQEIREKKSEISRLQQRVSELGL